MTDEPKRLTFPEIAEAAFGRGGATTETAPFTVEIQANVDAVDHGHALMLVALDLLRAAYEDDDGRVRRFGPAVPAGYIGAVDFTVGPA